MPQQKCSKRVKNCDAFGIDVTLAYQGSKEYNTVPGGICTISFSSENYGFICTIILFLGLALAFFIRVYDLMSNPIWNINQYSTIVGLSDRTMSLSTQQSTLAVWLSSDELQNVDQYYRAIYCSEYYAQQISDGVEFFVQNFGSEAYPKLCPKTKEMDLTYGIFEMEIISCTDAIKIDQEMGWVSYAGSTQCLDLQMDSTAQIITYAMGSQFDPKITPQTGETKQFIQESKSIGVYQDRQLFQSLEARQSSIEYQPSFFFSYQRENLTSFSYAWDINRYEQYPIVWQYNKYARAELYQSQKDFHSEWTQSSFLVELSLFGGLAIVCYITLSIFLSNFQHFVQNKSMILNIISFLNQYMMKRLYGMQDKDYENNRSTIMNPGSDITKHRENFKNKLEAHRDFEFDYPEFFCSALIVNFLP